MHTSEAPGALTVAGVAPRAVHEPRSVDELAAVLRGADGSNLVPVAAGTRLDMGTAPSSRFDLVHLAAALPRPTEPPADDMTVVAGAGATIDELNAVLAQNDQWLPLDPSAPGRATIGGTLAVGTNGPSRTGFGLPRDLLLGATVMRADGELVRAGGRVVKNV
ncbi:MAG: FAD-binding oxidoreductase, partial [Dehalococcoidia bacterium]|nr:FAD-binding oxidoreductase [Dehalococcoidia bacterium]